GYKVMSAGIGAVDGLPPSSHAIHALAELGIDISHQRSRMLTAQMVAQADYIFGMTRGHVDAVLMLYPQAAEKTFLLREFDETLEYYEKDISDPIGGSYDVYLSCRDQIQQGLESMLNFIEQSHSAHSKDGSNPKTKTVAIGADHGGFELKEVLKEFLLRGGLTVVDHGTYSRDSTDYPDFAHVVAHDVAAHKADAGLLVCTTGAGMSITANTVPGVRAALVFDEQMASLARQHNHANILCLAGKFTPPDLAKKMVETFLTTEFE